MAKRARSYSSFLFPCCSSPKPTSACILRVPLTSGSPETSRWDRWTLRDALARARARTEAVRGAVDSDRSLAIQKLRAARTLWWNGQPAEGLALAEQALEAITRAVEKSAARGASRAELPQAPEAAHNRDIGPEHKARFNAIVRQCRKTIADLHDASLTVRDVRLMQLRRLAKTLVVLLVIVMSVGWLIQSRVTYANAPWLARYYASPDFTGPVNWRRDAALSFDWGNGEPIFGMPGDLFSARWDTCIDVDAESLLSVTATYDDGVRVLVDGRLVTGSWSSTGPPTLRGAAVLEPGAHHVRVEYHEDRGDARVEVLLVVEGEDAALRRPTKPDGGCGDLASSSITGSSHGGGTSSMSGSRTKIPTPRRPRAGGAIRPDSGAQSPRQPMQ